MTDLADLETFVAVADAGGVSPAARRLGLPKSIVSRRLSRLETGARRATADPHHPWRGTYRGRRDVPRTRGARLRRDGIGARQHRARGRRARMLRVSRAAFVRRDAYRARPRGARAAPSATPNSRRVQRPASWISLLRASTPPSGSALSRTPTWSRGASAPFRGRTVASPAYLAAHGAPRHRRKFRRIPR